MQSPVHNYLRKIIRKKYVSSICCFLQTPNNRSNPQTVFSTYVGSDIVLPSAASSVNARSLNGEMVESIDCEWSEHICPDGFVYYYNCMTCESRVSFICPISFLTLDPMPLIIRGCLKTCKQWEKPEEFALYEKKLEKLDLQQQDQRNLRLPVRNISEVSQMCQVQLSSGQPSFHAAVSDFQLVFLLLWFRFFIECF